MLKSGNPKESATRVACIIPTFNGREDLNRLFLSISQQTLTVDVLVVDSSSNDGTYELALNYALSVEVTRSEKFNHGGTRQLMIDKYPNYEIYIFLTQDAQLADAYAFERIKDCLADPKVGAVCGRQLPHDNANTFAKFARAFNYPPEARKANASSIPIIGIKAAFMSNSFAAYRGEALAAVGGFPKNVILAEDMYVAARMLQEGWTISYCTTATCKHSHNYTLKQEFQRYFDTGVFHSRESWIREMANGIGGEGFRFMYSELVWLGIEKFHWWPYSLMRSGAKIFGFKLGTIERLIPRPMKKRLSMHKNYWN